MTLTQGERATLLDLLDKEIGRTNRLILKYEDNILQGLPYVDKLYGKKSKRARLLILKAKLKGGEE